MTPAICKASRALAGITQRDLAQLADIATPTIADFERGARTPHFNNLKAIAKAFEDLGISYLTDDQRIVAIDFRNMGIASQEQPHASQDSF